MTKVCPYCGTKVVENSVALMNIVHFYTCPNCLCIVKPSEVRVKDNSVVVNDSLPLPGNFWNSYVVRLTIYKRFGDLYIGELSNSLFRAIANKNFCIIKTPKETMIFWKSQKDLDFALSILKSNVTKLAEEIDVMYKKYKYRGVEFVHL